MRPEPRAASGSRPDAAPVTVGSLAEGRTAGEEAGGGQPSPSPSSASPSPLADAHPEPATAPSGAPWRALLVDDRSERRSLMRVLLGTVPLEGRTSIEVSEASDAADAADLQPMDVAVVEVQMAGGAGLEVVEALRAVHPPLVLVACSFRADREMRAMASLPGVDAYLAKPVGRHELLATTCPARRQLPQHSSGRAPRPSPSIRPGDT